MPSITLTLTDTPEGVSVHSSFAPAVGHPCSPAQAYALEIINRTHLQWRLPKAPGVDIDAVHRLRDDQSLKVLQQREAAARKQAADQCAQEWGKKAEKAQP